MKPTTTELKEQKEFIERLLKTGKKWVIIYRLNLGLLFFTFTIHYFSAQYLWAAAMMVLLYISARNYRRHIEIRRNLEKAYDDFIQYCQKRESNNNP